MERDVERFKDIVARRMNIKRENVFTNDASKQPSKALFMDIALAALGNVFLYTNTKSFFSGYIQEYRYIKMGIPLNFNLPMNIVEEFVKLTNYVPG
jgi:hypothetical protein